jgi:hypothetical protein
MPTFCIAVDHLGDKIGGGHRMCQEKSLISSTALTLLVLPAVYALLARWQERRERSVPEAR